MDENAVELLDVQSHLFQILDFIENLGGVKIGTVVLSDEELEEPVDMAVSITHPTKITENYQLTICTDTVDSDIERCGRFDKSKDGLNSVHIRIPKNALPESLALCDFSGRCQISMKSDKIMRLVNWFFTEVLIIINIFICNNYLYIYYNYIFI
eukprot:GHVL01027902.1.p1 GENE.GHVL01027902.1~~GHVL01027902.1.p1  ORF type:complete len:154 (+),score=28.02 GHVL01027902.1:135-596(+)